MQIRDANWLDELEVLCERQRVAHLRALNIDAQVRDFGKEYIRHYGLNKFIVVEADNEKTIRR